MKTLNNSLARQLTKNKTPDIELAEVIAVGKGTVDIKTSTGSIYRHVPIAGNASMGDDIRLQFVRNKPLAFGGNGSSGQSTSSGGGANIVYSGGALSAHALNGPYHTGQLDASQATWAFAVDGSRTMTGSINLGPGLLVDGIDVSVLGARSVLSSGLGLSGGNVLYSGDVTINLTSSSNPGAAAAILASNSSGLLQLMGFSIGVTPTTGALKIQSTTNQFLLAYDGSNQWAFSTSSTGNLTLGPSVANADFWINGNVGIGGVGVGQTEQLKVGYDSSNYITVNVSSTGVVTIAGTAGTPTNGDIFLNPANRLGIGFATTPNAKVEIRDSSGADQLRVAYDATAYADLQVGLGGNLTITTYGSDMVLDIQPTGGIAGTKTLRPANSYDVNLGSLTKKWLAIHAAELWVENLVAYDTTAIMGGRWNISNASLLVNDWNALTPGPATITFLSASSASQSSSSSWSVTKPTGSLQDHLVLVTIELSNSSTITPPAGFTLISNSTSWQGTRRVSFYYKVLGASEPASWTFGLSASASGVWSAVTYTNVDTTTPIHVSNFQANSSSTTMTAPFVTTTAAVTMLVMLGVAASGGSMTPIGMTERVDTANVTSTALTYVADIALSSAGATGNKTATISTSNQNYAGLVALLPATIMVTNTSTTLKHNDFSVLDIGRLEENGRVEWVQVTGGPTGSTGQWDYTFTRNLDGTGANDWPAGAAIVNTGQAGTGWFDVYSMWSSKGTPIEYIFNYVNGTGLFSANLSTVVQWRLFLPTGTISANDCIYYGMGGGMWSNINHYLVNTAGTGFTGVLEYWNGSAWTTATYTTAIALASTGVVTSLTAGSFPTAGQTGVYKHSFTTSQAGWAKTTVNGVSAYWMRHRATAGGNNIAENGFKRVIRDSAQYGPTMVGWVRNSTTFNDYSERFALGNLIGLYDYGKVTYGFVAGKYSQVWVATDDTYGYRIMNSNTMLGNWDVTGQITVGVNAASRSRVVISPTGRVSVYQKDGSSVEKEKFYVDNSGNMGLIGDNNNYFTVNGTTGVATFSGAINVISPGIDSNVNILYNSSLDADTNGDGIPDGWSIYNNAGTSVTPSIQSSGGVDNGKFYRLTINATNSGVKGIIADPTTLKVAFKSSASPVYNYVISWYAKATGGPVGSGCVMGWNHSPSTSTAILNPPLTGNWQRYAFKVNWLGTTVDPNIFISAANTTGYAAGATIDIDQVQAELSDTLTPYKMGPISYGMDINGIPISNAGKLVLAPTPSGSGLFLTSTLMGYYSGSQWQTYMDSSGNFMLRGGPTANIGVVTFNPSTARLSGGYYSGASYTNYVEQWYTDGSNGAIWAGGGTITLGKDGLIVNYGQNITFGSSTSPNAYASKMYAEAYYASAVSGGNFGETALSRLMIRNGIYGVNLVSSQMQNVSTSFQHTTANNTVLTGTATPFSVSASTAYEFGSWFYYNTASVTGTPDTQVQYSIDWYTAGSAYISTNSFAMYPPTSIDYGPKFMRFNATSPGTAALAHLRILKIGIGSGGTSLHGLQIIDTAVYTSSTYSSFALTNVGMLANGSLLFSNAWASYPDTNNGYAEISNDTGTFQQLMIVGNKSAGGTRHVGVWDQLYVHGNLIVDSGMRSPVYSSGLLNFTNYGVASWPISAGASAFSATVGESATIKFWHQGWYVAGTNDGSNYWTINMTNNAGTTMIASWTTASLGSNTWVLKSITGLSVAIGPSDKMLAINVSKTGAPGNLYLAGPMVYVQ